MGNRQNRLTGGFSDWSIVLPLLIMLETKYTQFKQGDGACLEVSRWPYYSSFLPFLRKNRLAHR